ncbi:MAG: hypothetical protein HYV03_01480 [Deltaproteobacteria bacterium]|nr:hypothetical protein [Deltaproteobacteria bacterium]
MAALETLTAKIDRFGRELAKGDPDATQRLLGYQAAFFAQWHKSLKLVADGLRATPITEADLPDALRRRYVSPLGRYVVYAYPTANLWEPSAMAAYIRDIRSIDPLVTGVPVEVYESSRLLERSFYRVAGLALLAICLLALGDFRNWRHAMLAVTPLLAGMLWLLEAMGWMGLPFNMANFFAVPILIGVGVDNGIQLIHRWRQEGFQPTVITRSTGAAVLLTSATTLASFAMLCTAAHRGIFSLGLLMSIGTVTCLVGSLILLPCLLRTSATR